MQIMAESSFLFSDEEDNNEQEQQQQPGDGDDHGIIYEDMHSLIANAHSFSTVPSSINHLAHSSSSASANAVVAGGKD